MSAEKVTLDDVTSYRTFRDKARGVWCFQVYLKGNRRIRKTAGKTQREALRAQADFLSQLAGPGVVVDLEPNTMRRRDTLDELAASYLRQLTGSPKTERSYRHAVERFLRWAGDRTIASSFNRVQAVQYVGFLRDSNLAENTVASYVAPLRAMWNYGIAIDLGSSSPVFDLQQNPWQAIRRIGVRRPRGRQDFLSREKVERVITAASAHSPLHGALVGTYIFAGLRNAEGRGLQWPDLNLGTPPFGSITVTGKGSKTRTVPISSQLRLLLDRYVQDRRDRNLQTKKGPVFRKVVRGIGRTGVARAWSQALEAAGVESMPLHCARHTAATLWIRAGVDLKTVAAWLGHESLTMVARYSHLAPDSTAQIAKLDEYMREESDPGESRKDPGETPECGKDAAEGHP